MARVCEHCGKKPAPGKKYKRRGLAKYKGGVGRKITGKSLRTFGPNLQTVKVREQSGRVRRVRLCARCLKQDIYRKA